MNDRFEQQDCFDYARHYYEEDDIEVANYWAELCVEYMVYLTDKEKMFLLLINVLNEDKKGIKNEDLEG
mgnify:CR=1 FL=1|tara:strand:- start:579 stop:785 length:207 start_codon:yes stop_codon:yes gene_type:complete